MPSAAFLFAIITVVVFAAACVPFLNAVKEEAPALYQSWGSPTVLGFIWNRQASMPFSGMLLRRTYREVLAPYPRSRAWASWLFLAQWLLVLGLVAFLFSIFR